jgi:hypothetical protein
LVCGYEGQSAEQAVEVSGPVSEDGGIEHLATAGALPGVEGANEIVIFLGEHSAFAFRAFHEYYLPTEID